MDTTASLAAVDGDDENDEDDADCELEDGVDADEGGKGDELEEMNRIRARS